MGSSSTPTYRVEYRDQGRTWQSAIWNVKAGPNRTGHGQPTDENAEKWRKAMNASFQAGGTNAHLAGMAGYVPHINAVRIVHQATGRVVATAVMPMFEVV
jgi:hypothetical protein